MALAPWPIRDMNAWGDYDPTGWGCDWWDVDALDPELWDGASRAMPPLTELGRFVVVDDGGIRAVVVSLASGFSIRLRWARWARWAAPGAQEAGRAVLSDTSP
jgi:hypothetical protein